MQQEMVSQKRSFFASLMRVFGKKEESFPQMRTVEVGGVEVDTTDWPDEVHEALARIKPSYPDRQYLVRVRLSATCTAKHSVGINVGIVSTSAKEAIAVAERIHTGGATVPCGECQKTGRVTGCHVYWKGPLRDWDGVR